MDYLFVIGHGYCVLCAVCCVLKDTTVFCCNN